MGDEGSYFSPELELLCAYSPARKLAASAGFRPNRVKSGNLRKYASPLASALAVTKNFNFKANARAH